MSSPAIAFATVTLVTSMLDEAHEHNMELAPVALVGVALRMGLTSPVFARAFANEIESLLSAEGQMIPSEKSARALAALGKTLYEQVDA